MVSSAGTSSRRKSQDQWLTFNCYQFSRGVTAERPRSRRWVRAEECLCTDDPDKISDATLLQTISFHEVSEEEETQEKKELEEHGWPPDFIGILGGAQSWVNVPSDFFDLLWSAATAADGVLRSITLKVQRHEDRWIVFEVGLSEKMGEPFKVQYDRRSRPILTPSRDDPVVRELRAVRAQLKWRGWSGIAIIALGVLVAL